MALMCSPSIFPLHFPQEAFPSVGFEEKTLCLFVAASLEGVNSPLGDVGFGLEGGVETLG
jgi:hypothetical protein